MVHPNSTRPNIQFNCTASGSPGLQIVWSHNGNLIPSDSEDFQVTDMPTEEGGGLISILEVKDPKLADSGNITCSASIRYRLADDGEMGELATFSHSFSRNLVILGKFLQNPAGKPFVFCCDHLCDGEVQFIFHTTVARKTKGNLFQNSKQVVTGCYAKNGCRCLLLA